MMIKIELDKFPNFNSSLEFFRALMYEQNVQTFPGEIFSFEGYLRIVLALPIELLVDGFERMKEFCEKYYVE